MPGLRIKIEPDHVSSIGNVAAHHQTSRPRRAPLMISGCKFLLLIFLNKAFSRTLRGFLDGAMINFPFFD
jgi:hypothetical protein